VPLQHHFEQNFHVAHRLQRHGDRQSDRRADPVSARRPERRCLAAERIAELL
jgi:hypothetical protein